MIKKYPKDKPLFPSMKFVPLSKIEKHKKIKNALKYLLLKRLFKKSILMSLTDIPKSKIKINKNNDCIIKR